MAWAFILLIRVLPGKAFPMKMRMGYRQNPTPWYGFRSVHDEDLSDSLDLINHRPQKYLGWRTAHESFRIFHRESVALGLTIRLYVNIWYI